MKDFLSAILYTASSAFAVAAASVSIAFAASSDARDWQASSVTLAQPACSTVGAKPEQFEVAIDRATGAAFVHSPCGWSLMGVLRADAIEEGITLANAKAVPASVLQAEMTLQPWLKTYVNRLAGR